MSNPTETLAALESQLADERAKVRQYEAQIAAMTPPRDPLMFGFWERKRLAAFKCAAHLVSKIESLKERMERDETLTKSEDG